MKKITLFISLLTIFVVSFFAVRSFATLNTPPIDKEKYAKLLQYISVINEKGHYNPQPIDNQLAIKVFIKYLNTLDVWHNIFLSEDIRYMFKYALELDDEMLGRKQIELFPLIDSLYELRVKEADSIRLVILNDKIDYTKQETYFLAEDMEEWNMPKHLSLTADDLSLSYLLKLDQLQFPESLASKVDAWRKRIKFDCISTYSSSIQSEYDKRKDTSYHDWILVDTLELQARQSIERRYNRLFNRIKKHFKKEKRFETFLSAIMNVMDPHSDYLSPVDTRSYEESTSGKFYGIGALLTSDDISVKIVSVSPGGAAWKSKLIDPNDRITKVGQGDEDSAIDILGYETSEAVKLIRGDKGTKVRLTLQKVDGSIKEVSLIRDKIFINQTFARSGIINVKQKKMGYLYLPEFYNSTEVNGDNPQSSEDVKKELEKLKAQKVDGIILDLRNNGGGYLVDAIKIAGLFIPKGPVVQVRDRDQEPKPLEDNDSSVTYAGPLMLLINEYSASASEILAAALQDYGRAFIVGSSSSFGKGTVQRGGLGIGRLFGDKEDLGTVNLTIQKFYRINGGSTQLKGVQPDIILPSLNDYLPVRERDLAYAIPYDSIPSADYTIFNPQQFNYRKEASIIQPLINQIDYYQYIKEFGEYLSKQREKPVPLDLRTYRKFIEKREQYNNHLDSIRENIDSIHVNLIAKDSIHFSEMDSTESTLFFQWYKSLNKDATLVYTTDIFYNLLLKQDTQRGRKSPQQSMAWLRNKWLAPTKAKK